MQREPRVIQQEGADEDQTEGENGIEQHAAASRVTESTTEAHATNLGRDAARKFDIYLVVQPPRVVIQSGHGVWVDFSAESAAAVPTIGALETLHDSG